MNADAEVMRDLGGPMSRADSDAKFDRYAAAMTARGFGRWLVETKDGDFLCYTGILAVKADHPLGEHYEIGWRLVRPAWGKGYASEAASAALTDGFSRVGLREVLAYTAPDNVRSQAVMERLSLKRDPSRDFAADYGKGVWHGLLWVARAG